MNRSTSDSKAIPPPTIDQLSGLLGEYLDASHIEVLEDNLLISAPYEVLTYTLDEVAKGIDFLHRPAVSYWRFFILVERTDQASKANLDDIDVVGLIDFKLIGGQYVPVHWKRGRSVQDLLSATGAMKPNRLEQYTLKFVEVDPLHFCGIWLTSLTNVGVDPNVDAQEWLIPTSSCGGLSALAEHPVEQVAATLVSLAKERELREREYYKIAAGEALDKLREYKAEDARENGKII